MTGRLLTAGCTTGWADWVHGELWLFPDGLLRARSDLATTIAHGAERTVPEEPVSREFEAGEIEALASAHKTNLWIPAREIAAAKIREGFIASSVLLTLGNGRRAKLLFPRSDRAVGLLREALESWGVRVP